MTAVAVFRLLFYAAILFGISELIYLDSITETRTGKFGEHSFTETFCSFTGTIKGKKQALTMKNKLYFI